MPHPLVPLHDVRYVLLDMDGTLLDKYFDDYFWQHLLPERYAEKMNITFGAARERLLGLYKAHEGTLNWTDIDFWSRQVELDIPALKEQIRHLIEVHPHVEEFLRMLRRRRKKVYLLTNAHYKVLDLKLKKTRLGPYLDDAVTSFEMGYPKEMQEFWEKARRRLAFDPAHSLFIDDTVAVLRAARRYGIRYLLHKSYASSRGEEETSPEFQSLSDFRALIPGKR